MLTLLTSNSFSFGAVPNLNPLKSKFCQIPQKELKECNDDSDSASADENTDVKSCKEKVLQVTRCQRAVKKAYNTINMKGCLFEMQAYKICQSEWCNDNYSSDECADKCRIVDDKLTLCTKKYVENQFRWSGLNEDGTS